MKLRGLSCTQFAGIRDRSISFRDGINVICGKNESGKSTMVNLLARTLFQNARLDRRKDREFLDLYFPGARKGQAAAGDFADGKVTFETASGTYTLTKEWGTDPRCTLSTPDGILRDPATIDTVLRDALCYGEGVYADILLSSQRNTDLALQTLLDATKKTEAKQEITDAVSAAFAESGSISADAIEQAIQSKIEELAGKHWDFDRDQPVRKAGRWATGLGEVLKAYYAKEDAVAVLQELSKLEQEADRAAADYAAKDRSAGEAEAVYQSFSVFASRLTMQQERKKTVTRLQAELQKYTQLLAVWPTQAATLETAKALQQEMTNRTLLDQYAAVQALSNEREQLLQEVVSAPSEEELLRVKAAKREITRLENQLCGMNLSAAIRMTGGQPLRITSLRTGETTQWVNDTIAITEAVTLTIPGVMELQLSPADVDGAAVSSRIAQLQTELTDTFRRYQADSPEALERLAKDAAARNLRLDQLDHHLTLLLGSTSLEALTAAVRDIPAPVRSKEILQQEILSLCGSSDPARYITARETVLDGYLREYGSVDQLKIRAFDTQTELQQAEASLCDSGDIPADYQHIADPERHLQTLQEARNARLRSREAALTTKTAAASRLEGYRDTLAGDPVEDAEKATRNFDAQKALLHHWLHIAQVFAEQKAQLTGSPMQDIADRFTQYLSQISGGQVSSEFPEADKLQLQVYSGNRLLDYGKLSEGTKETVSLAFRLAVLDHLFPDGGGILVLDDPLTDMDAQRAAQACQLIRACSTRHQIIFLTCREEYLELLDGHQISME